MTDKNAWLDTNDVCVLLNCSSRTVERYRKRPADCNPFPEPDVYNHINKWFAWRVYEWQQEEARRPKRRALAHLDISGKARDANGRINRSAAR